MLNNHVMAPASRHVADRFLAGATSHSCFDGGERGGWENDSKWREGEQTDQPRVNESWKSNTWRDSCCCCTKNMSEHCVRCQALNEMTGDSLAGR